MVWYGNANGASEREGQTYYGRLFYLMTWLIETVRKHISFDKINIVTTE